MELLQDTPIEKHTINNKIIYVKREDLACLPPGPPFAKVRGLYPRLIKLKKEGIKVVSYMETSVSMASWGISYFSKILGLKAVIFFPQNKDKSLKENQQYQFEKWKQFDAEVIPLEKPNRMQINFYRARNILKNKYPNPVMLPLGLPFKETVSEVARQVNLFDQEYGSIVLCVGSGTMTAGVLTGLNNTKMNTDVYGVFCAPKDIDTVRKKIYNIAEFESSKGGFNLLKKTNKISLKLYNKGYEYTQKEERFCPFPCNPYYDRKAWAWILENYENLKQPVLFWNIGSDFNLQK